MSKKTSTTRLSAATLSREESVGAPFRSPAAQKYGAAEEGARPLFGVPPVVWPLVFSVIGWTVIFIALPPARQNFPLHDDWAFARSAFAFFHREGINYFQWASMPQLGQWLWSMPFLIVLGESHFALRVSTVVLGWLALLAFYDLLRQAQVSKAQAAFAVGVLAFNPWFFLSQGTFMTDVPSLAFALGALALYGRALTTRSLRFLAGAVVVAMLGAITRQNTVAVGLATAIFLAGNAQLRRRLVWWLGVLLPVVVAGAVHLWFMARTDIKPMRLGWPTATYAAAILLAAIHTLGLVAIPVLLLDLRASSWKQFAWTLVPLLLIAYALQRAGRTFPYVGGVIDIWGAFTRGITVGERDVLLTKNICLFLSLVGCMGAVLLLTRIRGHLRPGGLLLLFSLIQFPLLMAMPKVYDRYLEFLMPAGLYLATTTRPISLGRWAVGGAALALSAVISVGLMHDWLAWNEARWDLGMRAIERRTNPCDIEGGFEWDGWFAPQRLPPPRQVIPPRRLLLKYSLENFPHINGRYALSFSVIPNTVAVDSQPFHLWLQPGKRSFYLIEVSVPPQTLKANP